jgi:hypothetical protein
MVNKRLRVNDLILADGAERPGFRGQRRQCRREIRNCVFSSELRRDADHQVPGHIWRVPELHGRYPCLRGSRIIELRRGDADYGGRGLLNAERAADRLLCTAKQAFGSPTREHHDVWGALLVIDCRQQPAGASTNAEHLEPLARHRRPLQRHGRSIIEAHKNRQGACVRVGRDAADGSETLADAFVRRVGQRPMIESTFRLGRPNDEQTVLVGHGEWFEEHAIHNAEHRRRGAHCERKRRDRDQGKARGNAQQARTGTKIRDESAHSSSIKLALPLPAKAESYEARPRLRSFRL